MLKKKNLLFSILIITFYFVLSSSTAFSQNKKIELSTCGLSKPYKVVGFVVYRSGQPDLNKINTELKKQAKEMKANYVIGVDYMVYGGYIYGYGTAVKTK